MIAVRSFGGGSSISRQQPPGYSASPGSRGSRSSGASDLRPTRNWDWCRRSVALDRWHLDRRAIVSPGEITILRLAELGDLVGEPDARDDQQDRNQKRQRIHRHPVTVVVRGVGLLV